MVTRKRRELGKEVLTFVDGDTKEVAIHAVAAFEKMRLNRHHRKIKLDKKGQVESVEVEDENYIKAVLKLSMGVQISDTDLEDIECDIKELYDKYFNDKLSKAKNPKSSDTSEQNQDKKSQA